MITVPRKFDLSYCLRLCLGLFLFVFPWQTILILEEKFINGYKWEYGTIGFYATEILLWMNVILFIIWFIKKSKIQNLKSKIHFSFSKDRIFVLSVLIFVLYVFASALWAGDKELALQQALHVLEAALLFFMLYLGPLDFVGAGKALIAGAVVQSVLGIWQFLTQSTFDFKWLGLAAHNVWESGTSVVATEESGRWLRAYGGFNHPNVFGGYLVLTLFVTLVLRHCLRFKNKLTEHLFFFAPAIQLAALFFTFSRSAWLAAVLVFCFFARHHRIVKIVIPAEAGIQPLLKPSKFLDSRLRGNDNENAESGISLKTIFYSVILFAILLIIFFPLVKSRVLGSGDLETRSAAERVVGYEEGWAMFKTRPLFGTGVGNYTVQLMKNNPGLPGWAYQPAHNFFLLGLAEWGIVGMVFLLLSFSLFFNLRMILAKANGLASFLPLLFFLPLLLFDHYLLSSFVGLALGAVYLAFFFARLPCFFPQLTHKTSTVNQP